MGLESLPSGFSHLPGAVGSIEQFAQRALAKAGASSGGTKSSGLAGHHDFAWATGIYGDDRPFVGHRFDDSQAKRLGGRGQNRHLRRRQNRRGLGA